jgi:acetoin utilization protein AcuB
MRVRDIMSRDPATLAPEATLAEALALMAERKRRHLFVVERGQVVGMLSDRDLSLYYDPRGMTEARWQATPVLALMMASPPSIGGDAPVHEAARLLLTAAVSALPVVDDGRLVGVLSDREFTRHFARGD